MIISPVPHASINAEFTVQLPFLALLKSYNGLESSQGSNLICSCLCALGTVCLTMSWTVVGCGGGGGGLGVAKVRAKLLK